MVKVFRVQHSEHGHGPYAWVPHLSSGSLSERICTAHNRGKHPSVLCPGEPWGDIWRIIADDFTDDELCAQFATKAAFYQALDAAAADLAVLKRHHQCGFISLEDLLTWFDGWMTPLEEEGFVVAVYEVEEEAIRHGAHQVTFPKDSVQLMTL